MGVTTAKFINKSSLFILLLDVIRRLELKPIKDTKVENIFYSSSVFRQMDMQPIVALR